MTILERLVAHPHAAVFDKSPGSVLAFRLQHPDKAAWSIADAVLTARAGASTSTYQLGDLTVGGVAAALASNGFAVIGLSSELAPLSALVLVEGEGSELVSNGDHLQAYTSLLWVLMGSYAGELRLAGRQVIEALRQMVITQAEGEWLDLWGRLYNEARRQADTDATYAARIPREAFRLRESPIAIEEAVKDATGKVIRIEEPWNDIFRLDESLLSGPAKLQDGSRTGYFLLQPTSATPIDWSDVLPVIHRNRAAGIMVLPPFARNRTETAANIDGTVHFGISRVHARQQPYEDRALLDYSNIEDIPILNHSARHRKEVRHVSESSALGWMESTWPTEQWSDSPYKVESYYFRSYRLYTIEVNYTDQYWPEQRWLEPAWPEDVIITSAHTRTT